MLASQDCFSLPSGSIHDFVKRFFCARVSLGWTSKSGLTVCTQR